MHPNYSQQWFGFLQLQKKEFSPGTESELFMLVRKATNVTIEDLKVNFTVSSTF